jgi:hypothetical protein
LILAFAFAVLFIAATDTGMAQTATSVSTTVKQPLNFMAQTCNTPEPITFTGTQDTIYEVVNDGTGVFKLNVHSSWENVIGTTVTGHNYPGTNISDEAIDLESLPGEEIVTFDQHWLGKGTDALNMVYTLTFNVKIDADGKVTAAKTSEIVECKP